MAKIFWIDLGTISLEQKLYRSISDMAQYKSEEKNVTASFFVDKNGLSCDLAIFSSPEKSRRGYIDPQFSSNSGLIEFSTKMIEEASKGEVTIRHDPLKRTSLSGRTQEPNYGHCIFTSKLTRGQSNNVRKLALILIEPTF
ncbi:MAG: hypothetical protein AB8G05_06290 [Oligoflexales bacterium]